MLIISGMVIKGLGEGQALGYPTANLALAAASARPAAGIYVAKVDGPTLHQAPAVLISGVHWERPGVPRVEVYIIGFKGDLYGQTLVVEVGERLRDVVQAASQHALLEQIKQDITRTRDILGL